MTLIDEEVVWQGIISRLKTSAALSYVKNVYEGERQVNTDNETPCIIVEPDLSEEQWVDFPLLKGNKVGITIKGVLNVGSRLDKQIVGDDTQVGIFRFEHDIKKAFEGSDFRYGNYIHNYEVRTSEYRLVNNSVREVVIKLTLEFKYFAAENRT